MSVNTSCRYAVVHGSLIHPPTDEPVYSVCAVHETWADDGTVLLLISQMVMGTPVTYTPPKICSRDQVVAMLRNSADAVAYAARLRDEDRKANA